SRRGNSPTCKRCMFTWAFPQRRQGIATGGLVNGAGQSGKTLITDGWTAATYAVRAGDWIGWTDATGRPALHHVTADITLQIEEPVF
ncbi:MAG TPA: hypothetical protein VL154_16215, partial [Acetobacteraceae bacterium]|nr:hypothetical protein [Acetobacteraceae bacterium]